MSDADIVREALLRYLTDDPRDDEALAALDRMEEREKALEQNVHNYAAETSKVATEAERLREENRQLNILRSEDRATMLEWQQGRDILLAALRQVRTVTAEGSPGGMSPDDDVEFIMHIARDAISEVEVEG